MSKFLKRAGLALATMLISPFMLIYLIGLKIVQGAKWVIGKIRS